MINWKVRIKNRAFWFALIPAVLLVAQVFAALFGYTLVVDTLGERLLACVNALFGLLTVLGIVADPTTEGLGDSVRALGYDTPHSDEKGGR